MLWFCIVITIKNTICIFKLKNKYCAQLVLVPAWNKILRNYCQTTVKSRSDVTYPAQQTGCFKKANELIGQQQQQQKKYIFFRYKTTVKCNNLVDILL